MQTPPPKPNAHRALLSLTLLAGAFAPIAAAANPTPTGHWLTDDKSLIIEITSCLANNKKALWFCAGTSWRRE